MENERSEEELLASIMSNTEMLQDEDLPPVPEPDQEEVEEVEEDIVEDEEVDEVEEDLEEEDEESDEEEAEETEAEPEGDVEELLDEEEVDWEYKVPVTIDGETQHVDLAELRKGYATQQHLSNQGRELGEARKEIDEYRNQRLGEVEQMAQAVGAMMGASEQQAAQAYHQIDAAIAQAREEGDTYKVQELKDEREVAQQRYWAIRQQREQTVASVQQAKAQVEAEEWNQKVQSFHNGIVEVIPDYNDEYAENLRNFALEEGVSEEYLNGVVDPGIVALVDNYRKLKSGVSAGAKKRAKAPVKKAPKRKAATEKQKNASKKNMTKARAFREDATEEDQMNFLRQHAERTLGFED